MTLGSPRGQMVITDSAKLSAFCTSLKGSPFVALDTEFIRERTYYAHLCLVQISDGQHTAAVDPLAPGIDLSPLRDLLVDPSVVKVFHAASQDLEIFLQRTGQVPAPAFDTQIAAAACGLGDQVGYAALVQHVLGIEIDKSSQATDWSLRPLTQRQLDYAIGDVTHLCHLYRHLVGELNRMGRVSWIADDMEALACRSRYEVDPREAFRRIRIRSADRRTLGVLRELAAWRETTAMARDLPRPWVIHDDALAEIAQNPPHDIEQLTRVRTLKAPVARGPDGKAILEIVRLAMAMPQDQWPQSPKKRAPSPGSESLVALLQALLRLRCEAHQVAPRIVASGDDLELLATTESPDIPALKGWRREIFGADALLLREGRLALCGHQGGVVAISPAAFSE